MQIWEYVASWCKFGAFYLLELKDLVNFHNQIRGSPKWRRAVYTVMQTTIWCLWKK
ncbi:hypothetical protein Hanom_Chr12g01177761 [Helianthus anomalus]